jgi:hypothetical protein
VLCANAAFNKYDLNFRKKLIKYYIWNTNICGAEALTLFGTSIRNTLKVFRCCAGEDG